MVWTFDGVAYGKGYDGLNALKKLTFKRGDCIEIQAGAALRDHDKTMPFEKTGLLNMWYKQGVQFRFRSDTSILLAVTISWHGWDGVGKPTNATFEFNGKDIGGPDEAKDALSKAAVGKDNVVLVLPPWKMGLQSNYWIPEFLLAQMRKWKSESKGILSFNCEEHWSAMCYEKGDQKQSSGLEAVKPEPEGKNADTKAPPPAPPEK